MGKFITGNSAAKGHGRPLGNSLQRQLRDAVGPRFDELVDTLLNAAAGGDMQAMSLLMSRMIPAVRPVQEPVPFNLVGKTMTDKAGCILDAVAAGELSPSDGKALLDGVGGVVKVQDAEQTARQLELIKLSLDAQNRQRPQTRQNLT